MSRLVRTTSQRLLPSSASGYTSLVPGAGEPEVLRADMGGDPGALTPGSGRTLLRLLHVTDMHVMDAGSPARSDWVETRASERKWLPLLHMARPHDLLANWGSVAFGRAIAEHHEPADLVIFTGDNIDNAQRNELDAYLAIAGGGDFSFPYEGPQRSTWAADTRSAGSEYRTPDGLWPFWLPDGGVADRFRSSHSFPTVPGLIDAAAASVTMSGVGVPWISVMGNHDVMRQGTVFTTAELEAIATGNWRALGAPVGFDPDDPIGLYLKDPTLFSSGHPRFEVNAVPGRRAITSAEFIRAHIEKGAGGFGSNDSPDYTVDREPVRIILLDTNHPTGHYQGSVGLTQLAWLDDRLREWVGRPVVVASHHGSVALENTFGDPVPTDRRLAADMEEVLLRYGNVVAWLVGHRHVNRIRPLANPDRSKPGLWEITTASVIDYPCQIRSVAIVEGADGSIGVHTESLDHDAHVPNARNLDATSLAAWHREIAFNTERLHSGRESGREGRPGDRNAFLALPPR